MCRARSAWPGSTGWSCCRGCRASLPPWLHVFPYSKRDGTPAAKIPNQVNGNVVKERAARLRAAGDAQIDRHLAEQLGKTHRILMENPHMGRTEQFTEVAFAAPQAEGRIVTAAITGASGSQLTA